MLSFVAKYHADNLRVKVYSLEQHDLLSGRSEGGKLVTTFQATMKVWVQVFGVGYKIWKDRLW